MNWDLGYSYSSSAIYTKEDSDMNKKLKYHPCSNPLVLCRVNTCGLTTCIYSSAISANTMSWMIILTAKQTLYLTLFLIRCLQEYCSLYHKIQEKSCDWPSTGCERSH